MESPEFSIIVPVFDGERFVEHALRSVAEQTHPSWECIVVDDGSRDGSLERVERWRESVAERVTVLRHPGGVNRGLPATRNLAAAHAKGRWLAFLDQDDAWKPDKLAAQHEAIERAPEVDAWTSRPEVRYEGVEPPLYVDLWARAMADPELAPGHRLPLSSFLTGCPFFMSSAIVRREAFASVGGFDEDLPRTSDWLLWACLASRRPLGLVPRTLAVYRFHGNNEMAALAGEPLGLALACLEVQERLVEWMANDQGIDRDQAAAAVHEAADWSGSARRANIRSEQLWRLLAGS